MCPRGRESLRCMRNFLHISLGNHSGMIVNYVTVWCCIKYVLCEPIIEYLVVDIRMNVSMVYIYGKKGDRT
jgi:hypothetical protein